MTEDLIFLSCQPNEFKYVWEIEVQIVNFRKFGISKNMHVVIWYRPEVSLGWWAALKAKYPEVSFFFYENQNADTQTYVSVIRPNALKQHFKQHEYLKEKTIFYHDSDIIFQRLPDFQSLLKSNILWQSDTSGYLDYNYLRSKEIQGNIEENLVVKGLADIAGIDWEIIKSYTAKTGGAQYILKNIDHTFWEDVEDFSLKIIKYLSYRHGGINSKYFANEDSGFQSWCADMWAVNFALWKRNFVTDITPELAFSWATDRHDIWFQKPIYHNAGATHLSKGLFYKADWKERSPIGAPISVSKNFCSWYYVEAIKEVK